MATLKEAGVEAWLVKLKGNVLAFPK